MKATASCRWLSDRCAQRHLAAPCCRLKPGVVWDMTCRRSADQFAILTACSQDTVVAIRKAGDRLVIANLHGDAYPEASFTVDPQQVAGCDGYGQDCNSPNCASAGTHSGCRPQHRR